MRVRAPGPPVAEGNTRPFDYASAFRVRTAAAHVRSPREWTRVVFEGAPPPLAWFVRVGWLLVLRLRLTESPEGVAGWRVVGADADSATLAAESPLLTARNAAIVDDDGLTWATYVRFRGPLGRLVWTIAARVHHVVIPILLRRAVRRTEREPATGTHVRQR